MRKEKLKISLLGEIEVSCKNKVVGIANSKAKSKKIWVLFEYLVFNHNRKVIQSELFDVLWPNEEIANPANSLKVLAFKLRSELDRLEYYVGKDIIQSVHGGYSFNDAIPHEIDVVVFDEKIEKSKNPDLSEEKQIGILHDALKSFNGPILVDSYKEPWVASLHTRYNEVYKSEVQRYVELLLEKEDYEGVIDMCRYALLIQPFEQNHYYYLIKAYAAMENYSAAAEVYKQVSNIMQKEYGVTVDKKFEGAYKDILKERPKTNLSAEEFQDEFEEKINFVACFYVEYGEFRQIYRYIARKLERLKYGAYMCIYTLEVNEGASVTDEEKRNSIRILGEALSFSLRQGDVFTRAAPNQFAVILEDITEENAHTIAKRISSYFERHRKSADFGISHTLVEIQPSDFERKNKR